MDLRLSGWSLIGVGQCHSKGSRKSPLGKAIAMELTVKSLLDRSSIMFFPNFTASGLRPSVYPASVLSEVTSHVLLLGVLTPIVPKRAPCVKGVVEQANNLVRELGLLQCLRLRNVDAKASSNPPAYYPSAPLRG